MAFTELVLLKCPRCGKGRLFKGVFKMFDNCSNCHLKYDRAEGYYTMAILLANFMYALIVAPTLLIMTSQNKSVYEIALTLFLASLIFIPLIFRYSRAIWLHFDFFIHPE